MKRLLKQVLCNYSELIKLIGELAFEGVAPSAEAIQLPSVSEAAPELAGEIAKFKAPKLKAVAKPRIQKTDKLLDTGNGHSNAKTYDICDKSIPSSFYNGKKPLKAMLLVGKNAASRVIKTKVWTGIFLGVMSALLENGLPVETAQKIISAHHFNGMVELKGPAKPYKKGANSAIDLYNGMTVVTPLKLKHAGKTYVLSGNTSTLIKINVMRDLSLAALSAGVPIVIEVELQ